MSPLIPLYLCALLAADSPARVGITAKRDLELTQAIELAVRQNVELEIEHVNQDDARAALEGAKGFSDPKLLWEPGFQSRNIPAVSILDGVNGHLSEHYHTENFLFREQTPWYGAGFDIAFENSRISSGNPFVTLRPFYLTQIALTYTQPLWRNRETDAARSLLKVRVREVELSRADLELKLIDVVARVEQAYWNLAAARQAMEVEREAVDLAEEQMRRDARRIQAGTLAEIELAASRTELARRQDAWYAAAQIVTEQENALKRLVCRSVTEPIWGEDLVPVDTPTTVPLPRVDEAVASALRSRVELRSIAVRREITQANRKQNANLVKPQVNLVASYRNQGLAGTIQSTPDPLTAVIQPAIENLNVLNRINGVPDLSVPQATSLPDYLSGGYGSSLGNLFAGRYQTVQVGLQVDLTIRNRAAKAALAQSEIDLRRNSLERSGRELAIAAEVRDAIEALAIAEQRLAAAKQGEQAAREKLESETRLFEGGESTNFLTLTRQNEYSAARRRTLIADLDHERAVSRFRQATGETLRENRVTIE